MPQGIDAQEALLARCRETLFHAREKRIRPGWDDKVLADWNGLAIAGLVRAASVFQRADWLARAEEAFAFIVTQLAAPSGGVQHAWRLGRVTAAGMIDDQAAIARAALALHEATGKAGYLSDAVRIVAAAEAGFADGEGGFFTTAAGATDVPVSRPRTAADNATPAGNGLMAEVFARLFHLTGEPRWRVRTEAALRALTGHPEQLSGMPTLLAAADLLEEAACVVVAGETDSPSAPALVAAALALPDPAVVVLRVPNDQVLGPAHPAFGKIPAADGTVAYVCRRNVCGLPIDDGLALAAALRQRS